MGFLTSDDAPVIWRGPMLHGVIKQFFMDVRWNDLDYLVVDLPPGTGDVALSLSQTVYVAGAIVVTTPQQVALSDTRRAVAMYQKLNIPVLGLVENMSYFACPSCQHESDIFGRGGGERLAEELGVPFLGSIPISEPLREGGDTGRPIMLTDTDVARGEGVHGRRRAHGGAGVDPELQVAVDHSAQGSELKESCGREPSGQHQPSREPAAAAPAVGGAVALSRRPGRPPQDAAEVRPARRRHRRRTASASSRFADVVVIRQVHAELQRGAKFRAVMRTLLASRDGQLALDFRVGTQPAKVIALRPPAAAGPLAARADHRPKAATGVSSVPPGSLAEEYFTLASSLDDGSPETQERAAEGYRQALALEPCLVPALINLANIHYAREFLIEAHGALRARGDARAGCVRGALQSRQHPPRPRPVRRGGGVLPRRRSRSTRATPRRTCTWPSRSRRPAAPRRRGRTGGRTTAWRPTANGPNWPGNSATRKRKRPLVVVPVAGRAGRGLLGGCGGPCNSRTPGTRPRRRSRSCRTSAGRPGGRNGLAPPSSGFFRQLQLWKRCSAAVPSATGDDSVTGVGSASAAAGLGDPPVSYS